METIRVNMTPNCHEVETIHASQNDTSLRKCGIKPYDYEGNDVTNQQDKATLVDIKGQTLKWNQLIQNGNFIDTTNWKAQNGYSSLSVANNVATVTLNGGSPSPYNPALGPITFPQSIANHKYYVHVEMLSPADGTLYDGGGTVTRNVLHYKPISANVWTTFQGIGNAQAEGDVNAYLGLSNASSVLSLGDSLSYRNYMVIDLTQLFGSTLADSIYNMEQSQSGSGVAYFKSLFPLDFYPYNSGSLIPFMGNGIKIVGKNLLPTQNLTKVGDNYRIGGSASYYHLPQGTYTFSSKGKKAYAYYQAENDSANNIIHDNSTLVGTFTLAEGNYRFWFYSPNSTADEFYDIQLEFGNQATSYEPYTESLLNLPISTYFPNGMKQAGDVYDELTPSKAITRIGAVDLGSLTWVYSNGRFLTDSVSNKANGITNLKCAIYETSPSGGASGMADKTIKGQSDNARILVHDSAYTDVTTFKNSVQGQYLYYELATPTETDISPELDLTFNIDVGGTEELLPTNTSTLTTTPLNATIKYPAETKDVYFTYQVSDFLSTVFKFYLVTKGIQIPCELEDDTLVIDCTSEISNEPGFFDCKIKAENDLGQIFSNKFQLHIERSPQ